MPVLHGNSRYRSTGGYLHHLVRPWRLRCFSLGHVVETLCNLSFGLGLCFGFPLALAVRRHLIVLSLGFARRALDQVHEATALRDSELRVDPVY